MSDSGEQYSRAFEESKCNYDFKVKEQFYRSKVVASRWQKMLEKKAGKKSEFYDSLEESSETLDDPDSLVESNKDTDEPESSIGLVKRKLFKRKYRDLVRPRPSTCLIPDESSEVSNDEPPPKRKKLIAKKGRTTKPNIEGWEKNIAKKKRNSGENYISYSTKKEKNGLRSLGPQCKDGCFEKLTVERAVILLNEFWDMGDYNKQNQYLNGCISEVPFKRKYTKEEVSLRPLKTVYTVSHYGINFQVCRTAFLSIHGIKTKRLKILLTKRKASASGTPKGDQRGAHPNARKIRGPQAETLHEHIKNLPVVTSHYSREKNPHRQYLASEECGKNIPSLYHNYTDWLYHTHPDVEPVLQCYYKRIFTTEYNIEFKAPKVDVCNLCTILKNKINSLEEQKEDTTNVKKELDAHLQKASDVRALLRQHEKKPSPGVKAIAIDLQQTIPCPKLNANKAYYLRKLWLYNFCIHDCNKNISHMYLWDETQGARGAIEIGS